MTFVPWRRVLELAQGIEDAYVARKEVDVRDGVFLARAIVLFQSQMVSSQVRPMGSGALARPAKDEAWGQIMQVARRIDQRASTRLPGDETAILALARAVLAFQRTLDRWAYERSARRARSE
jgi:hypothetical protein